MRTWLGLIFVLLTCALPTFAQDLTANEFPTFGCVVRVPKTWQVTPALADVSIGSWSVQNQTTGKITMRLDVQRVPADKKTLQEYTKETVKLMHGKQFGKPFTLDDKPALRVKLGKRRPGYPQHEIVICQRDGQNYVLEFLASARRFANSSERRCSRLEVAPVCVTGRASGFSSRFYCGSEQHSANENTENHALS